MGNFCSKVQQCFIGVHREFISKYLQTEELQRVHPLKIVRFERGTRDTRPMELHARPLSTGTLLAVCMSRMTGYIVIEDIKCHFLIFASFANWIKASLPNNAMVCRAAEIVTSHDHLLSHLMTGDNFLSGNLNNKVLATSLCDLEDRLGIFDMN